METAKITEELERLLPKKPLLRVDEVADLLDVSRVTVYRWFDSGKLSGSNIGGVIRISRQSVITLVERGASNQVCKKSFVRGWK